MASQLLVDLDGLQVSGSWRQYDLDFCVDATISASAFPFSGTVETVFTQHDLITFRDALRALSVPGRVALGGGRTTLLALDVREQTSIEPDRVVVEVTLIPSEDDGWPMLRYLIFDVDPSFAARSVEAINEFLQGTGGC
jgi:hypothetical protein